MYGCLYIRDAPGSFDGVATGEGARRHQLLPGREVVDGPHIVLGGVEADPAELAGGQPSSVEDEPHLVQRLTRAGGEGPAYLITHT